MGNIIGILKKAAEVALYLLIFIGICIHLLKPPKRVESIKVVERIDTIVKTITEERIVYRDVVRHDTVWLERIQTDTIKMRDTVRVLIPIERKVYADSLYRAVVSGYKASLDSITIYPRTTIIEKTKMAEPRRVSVGLTIGPQAGYYATPKGWQPGIGFGVTLGITIDLRKWKLKNGTTL